MKLQSYKPHSKPKKKPVKSISIADIHVLFSSQRLPLLIFIAKTKINHVWGIFWNAFRFSFVPRPGVSVEFYGRKEPKIGILKLFSNGFCWFLCEKKPAV
jgi:hypothetical protein